MNHRRPLRAACALILLTTLGPEVPANANLLSIDFEGSVGWTGTDSFIGETATNGAAPNGARFFDFIGTNVISEAGVWIDDPSRAFEGDRMFWLQPYNDPDTICVGGRVDGAIECSEVTFQFNFAAFDLNHPTGDSNTFSMPAVEIMSWDSASSSWAIETATINFDDGQVTNPATGEEAEYAVGDWDNLQWYEGTSTFKVPVLNNRPLYLWTSMTNDSNGLLIDNIRIAQVPEPSSLALVLVGSLLAGTRRRRRLKPDGCNR